MSQQSLAYQPKEFFMLGATLAQWATQKEIFASFPVILETEDRAKVYFYVGFGYCPLDSGTGAMFAYDDLNKTYHYWDDQDEGYNWDKTALENAEDLPSMQFSKLEDLTKYIATGEQPESSE